MSTTTTKDFSHAEIAREIRRLNPSESVTSSFVGNVRRGDATSARVSRLIAEACLSLRAKARGEARRRRNSKAVAA